MRVQGISLHIGVNRVDPGHYGGWDGELQACEHDARDMRAIADSLGYRTGMLLTREATAEAVMAAIGEAARELRAGDMYLLTYAGHGGQVPDTNGDEDDPEQQDETWLLWDRQLIDDELWALWGRFRAGVRIVVISDSCHSGTVTRQGGVVGGVGVEGRARLLPPRQAAKVYRAQAALYDGIQEGLPGTDAGEVRASVILISGCQDNQLSLDGPRNGLFTGNLKKVWRNGRFKGGYRKFRDAIARRMPERQTPNYTLIGRADPAFEARKPFELGPC